MKERQILFTGAMVRALLDGSKTQTRRVVKPRGWPPERMSALDFVHVLHGQDAGGLSCAQPVKAAWAGFKLSPDSTSPAYFECPYGQPGDRLWVRETVAEISCRLTYKADSDDGAHCVVKRWTPSIHMPREWSRILLEIVAVRVERLQDVSEADARAEGTVLHESGLFHVKGAAGSMHNVATGAYRELWESINGADSWVANPWVWVVEFKRVAP
jgi:hypothetical protein